MFNPTRGQAREFLFEVWRKHRETQPLTPLEAMTLDVVAQHPEYHAVLEDRERFLDRDWKPEGGETNPFMHLQMHLAIEEQLSIDQPPGIREAVRALSAAMHSEHKARHAVMECLAEMLWNAQRHGSGFDNAAYLDCVKRRTPRKG